MGKKVTVYMIDGSEYGPRTIEVGNWVGKAIFASRATVNSIFQREEFSKPGIYCLKSEAEKEGYDEKIYIGEAENIGNRLKSHLSQSGKDFNELIFFISKDELLTKTQIKYLESRIIQLAYDAKAAEIENNTQPTLPTMHEADISDMEYFLDQIKLILSITNFKFLIPTTLKPAVLSDVMLSTNIQTEFKIRSSNLKAFMYETEQGFIVKKGSQASVKLTPSITSTYRKLREKLINTGILILRNGFYEFLEDTIFTSPSAASNIVLGRQSPGPIEWVTEDNKTYKEVSEIKSSIPSIENGINSPAENLN